MCLRWPFRHYVCHVILSQQARVLQKYLPAQRKQRVSLSSRISSWCPSTNSGVHVNLCDCDSEAFRKKEAWKVPNIYNSHAPRSWNVPQSFWENPIPCVKKLAFEKSEHLNFIQKAHRFWPNQRHKEPGVGSNRPNRPRHFEPLQIILGWEGLHSHEPMKHNTYISVRHNSLEDVIASK